MYSFSPESKEEDRVKHIEDSLSLMEKESENSQTS